MHWSAQYLNRPYVEDEYTCASLFLDVQAEVFGRERPDTGDLPPSLRARMRLFDRVMAQRAQRTEIPLEGDAVLMRRGTSINHIGVFCKVDGVEFILHNVRDRGARLTMPKDIYLVTGHSIEGFYQWR